MMSGGTGDRKPPEPHHGTGCVWALIALVSLILGGAAWAAEDRWVRVSKPGSVGLYIDQTDLLAAGPPYPKVWVKIDYSGVRSVKQRTTIARWGFDCSNSTVWTMTSVNYAADGRIIGDYGASSPDYIIPDSLAEIVFKRVCATP